MPSVLALLDANVLYDAVTRDLILEVAETGLIDVRWSEEIEEETRRALQVVTGMSDQTWNRLRRNMRAAALEPLIEGYDDIVHALSLPDPDDRHVLAAAIHAGTDHIVTNNLSDFPPSATDPHGIVAIKPDLLLLAAIVADGQAVLQAARRIQQRLHNPPIGFGAYLDRLKGRGLPLTAEALRAMTGR